jgi:hypothetical protein
MANKKISELESRASLSLSDLMAVGDPSTGYLYKTTISDLKTLTGAGVVSFNGRFGTVMPAEGDYTLTQLGDVIITSATNGQVLQYNGSNWVNTTLPADNDTLDIVTGRGNTTSNSITVGSVTAAGLSNLVGQIRTFATTGNTYMGVNPASATDAGYKLDVNGFIRASQLATGAHSFRNEMYITSTTDGYAKQNSYNAASAFTMGFIGDLRFGSSTAIKSVFSFNGAYSNNGTVYGGDVSLIKIFTSDALGNPTPSANINGYGINLMPTLNYTQSTSNFTGIYYNPTLTATTGLTHYAMNLVAGLVRMGTLAGTGSRMVVADANGDLSTQAIPTSAVSSVFGRTGVVVAANGDYTTSQVTEGTNLYYTDARARAAITLTTTGSSGAATYSGGTLNIPTYTLAGLGGQPALSGTGFVKISGTTISYDNSTYLTTSSAASTYLPLAGGTLTGALNGTTGTFSGLLRSNTLDITTGTGTFNNIEIDGTGRGIKIWDGVSAYQTRLSFAAAGAATFSAGLTTAATINSGDSITMGGELYYGGITSNRKLRAFSTGAEGSATLNYGFWNGSTWAIVSTLNSSGVATFSSSVTAGGYIYANSGIIGNNSNNLYLSSNSSGGEISFWANQLNTRLMTLTGAGNLGLGVVPSAWLSSNRAFQIGYGSVRSFTNSANTYLENNNYVNTGGTDIYLNNGAAARYRIADDSHIWYQAPSGTAGAAISFTQAMTLDASGRLTIGNTNISAINERLNVTGNGIAIEDTDGGRAMLLGHFGGADGILGTYTNDALQIRTNNTARFVIGNDGNIAMGNFSPSGTPPGDYRSFEIGRQGNTISAAPWKSNLYLSTNATITAGSTTFTYRNSGVVASLLSIEGGDMTFSGAASGTAGTGISFTERFKVTSEGAIKTGEPGTGWGRAEIRIGARATGEAFNSGGYLPVNVDGTIYYINLYSSTP